MSEEKQIDEMAKQIYGNFGLIMSTARNVAKYLTNKKGYRKASEVAAEVFAKIEHCMSLFEDDDDGYLLKKCEFEYFMRELKEEYKEGENNGRS